MEEMFDKLKAQASKLKDSAVKITKTVVDKTNNVASQTKIKFAISETQDKIKDIYAEMGKTVYDKYKSGDDVCDCMTEKCAKIDSLFEEVAELNKQLAELKETVKCPQCDAYNNSDDAYCSKCGSKMENTEQYEEDDEQVIIINPKKPTEDEE